MRVAIVGGADSAKYAPFEDESWEIWVLGNQLDKYHEKRITRIFEIHEDLSEHDDAYPTWLAHQHVNMVVSDRFPIEGEHIIEFDYDAASNLIGENFSSSPAVMMAQAIMDGATDIAIYGVEMAVDDHEYFLQRPCMEQWIGYARGAGINVVIPEESTLGKTDYREGRDWPKNAVPEYSGGDFADMANTHRKQMEDLEAKINQLAPIEAELEILRAKYQGHDGARQSYERLSKVDRANKSGIPINLKDGVKYG